MKKKMNAALVAGLIMLLLIAAAAVFCGVLAPNNPYKINMSLRFAGSSGSMPLGADAYGRCVLSRLMYGARYSMGLAAAVIGSVALLATPLGILCAFRGGIADKLFVLSCDISMAMPPAVLVLAVVGVMGNGLANLLISAVFAYWGWYGRMVRSYTQNESGKTYIVYAKTAGLSALGIAVKHIFPNIAPNLIVLLAMGIGDAVLMISGFSFLGIGLPAGTPEWGAMLSEAKSSLIQSPRFAVYPGLCVLFSVCACNITGEGLRLFFSPYRSLRHHNSRSSGIQVERGSVIEEKTDGVSVLSAADLCIEYPNEPVKICNVNFSIKKGKIFALIGESGSGKTSVCKAILGLLEGQALQSGSIRLCGKELLPLAHDEHRRINGRDIGYIMQNPHAAFDPCMKIKNHFIETIKAHLPCSRRDAFYIGCERLRKAGLYEAVRVMESYPHQLSGGMLQRVMIAIAFSLQPVLLVADEPTGALDSHNSRLITDLLVKTAENSHTTVLFASHDMNAVENIADTVAVMKDGKIVEYGAAKKILQSPRHAYTAELLAASRLGKEAAHA